MHPIRRRKKRPNYGVRSVEVCRGKNGFGFTISGQQPCILSCIVTGSPAEKAGLRPGDYLVAVNGQSVSKVPHDDVVRLIGCSSGILKLQIAENYYSDSSDEDIISPARPKPKYLHKPRSGGQHHRPVSAAPQQNRAAKVVRDLRTGAMFEEHQQLEVVNVPSNALIRPVSKSVVPPVQRWEPPVPLPLPPLRPYPHPQVEKPRELERTEFQALVGYLGTIEMPKELQPGSRLQVVRGCIRRLRAEKRAHTLVLMSVHTHSLTLKNCHQATIAEYPAERVTFCGSSSDDEHRFFGLVTTAVRCVDDENDSGETVASSSCHVFAVELRLHGVHAIHAAKAEAFKLNCNTDHATGVCSEFPASSDPIIAAIKVLYCNKYERGNVENEEPLLANSPQPSNASSTNTTASSNSDSGIGFRDDCGNQSDRILMVDIQNQRLHIQQVGEVQAPTPRVYELSGRLKDNASARLTVRAMPDPAVNTGMVAASNRSRSPLSSSSGEDGTRQMFADCVSSIPAYSFPINRSHDDMSVSSGTNRSQGHLAFPYKPDAFEIVAGFHPHFSEKVNPECYSVPGFSGLSEKIVRSTEAMSVGSSQSQDPLLSYKLSPKVFGLSRPVTHSLEDLKVPEPTGLEDPSDGAAALSPCGTRSQQWGSLQELRSFVANCFEASPVPELMHSDQEPTSLEQEESEKGVASWAISFEKLLDDPAGLHTFAEFLKKEFSHENIYFWVACERYRELNDEPERKQAAKEIFERHLCLGALEPVNVDSHARQVTQEGLQLAPDTLFVQAQKQIFDLMKFDSYPRFIKSDLYKECLRRQLSGQELPFSGGDDLDSGLQLHPKPNSGVSPNGTRTKLKKSRSDAEDRRRKSLLPWHRKIRSKSKDRGESEYKKFGMKQRNSDDTASVRSDVTSSRSSLASWDLAQSVTTCCRVILPDGATTVVQIREHENIRDMVKRLLDKRGLHYTSFEVYAGNMTKAISLDESSTVLVGKEVQVEQRVSFRLDLPNRKTVGVKSKPTKSLGEVLRPILHKYGYNVELVTLCLMSENEVLELSLPVLAVDNQRLQVLTRSAEAWKSELIHKTKSGPTLDEITNRVFEELLQGKAEGRTTPDQISVKSEDWGSEHSSGIFSRFLRRDSGMMEKSKDSRSKNKKVGGFGKNDDTESKGAVVSRAIAKWKVGQQGPAEKLYEGLKRAQSRRIEDQRGTEINFELPDFLKDKENAPQAGKKLRKLRKSEDGSQSKFFDISETQQCLSVGGSHESLLTDQSNKGAITLNKDTSMGVNYLDSSFSTDGVIPSPRQAEKYFLERSSCGVIDFGNSCKLSAQCNNIASGTVIKSNEAINRISSPDSTLVDGDLGDVTLTCDSTDENGNAAPVSCRSRQLSDPPPLPPKPKHLPSKASLWGASTPPNACSSSDTPSAAARFIRPNDVKKDARICRSRRAVYLDQPSSSFV